MPGGEPWLLGPDYPNKVTAPVFGDPDHTMTGPFRIGDPPSWDKTYIGDPIWPPQVGDVPSTPPWSPWVPVPSPTKFAPPHIEIVTSPHVPKNTIIVLDKAQLRAVVEEVVRQYNSPNDVPGMRADQV